VATIAIIGGSGPEGRGLGLRFAMAGHSVILGSRDVERGRSAAQELLETVPGLPVAGAQNQDAAHDGDWVVFSVPFEGLEDTVKALAPDLAGKIVVSVVAPMEFKDGTPHAVVVPEGSAAELVRLLAPESRVVSAFHHVSARDLLDPEHVVDGDIIVCGDDGDAKSEVMELSRQVQQLRAVDGGGLANSSYVEQLTTLLLRINRLHRSRSMVRLVGLKDA
jgi:8-hydroxy-5-deazaflavin:NADPH oxidoreductase